MGEEMSKYLDLVHVAPWSDEGRAGGGAIIDLDTEQKRD